MRRSWPTGGCCATKKIFLKRERKTALGRPKSRWKGIIETDMEKYLNKTDSGKVIAVQAKKAYVRLAVKFKLFFNLNIIWTLVVSFRIWPPYLRGKCHRFLLNRRKCGSKPCL
jgi:predicted DCC family thiol-disulfide oxidoreductase YuxK